MTKLGDVQAWAATVERLQQRISELEAERDELIRLKDITKNECRMALVDKFFERSTKVIYRAIQNHESFALTTNSKEES